MRKTVQFIIMMAVIIPLISGVAFAEPASSRLGAVSLKGVDTQVMDGIDKAKIQREDLKREADGMPYRYAVPFATDITVDERGSWTSLSDGTQIWRLIVHSPEAESLNFGFTRYQMPVGGELYIYSPDMRIVRGPFTEHDNEVHGQLWSPILKGDTAVIELNIPESKVPWVELELTAINHGYRGLGTGPGDKSGSCNIDVVCPEGDEWRDDIRSVGVISTGGSTFCSGFLVNNVRQDLTPYFMTANHCGITSSNAASLVVYWNFETSTCGGSPDGALNQFQTGSIFRAGYSSSDVTLVELDDPPADAHNVYWAGWDASEQSVSSAVAIHHPNTDEKRISFEDAPLQITSYLGTSVPGDSTHWRVIDWDLGTTEPGSSGSGLWDQNHRIIGQLHGGYAACGNDDSDWYGMFSVSWDSGGSSAQRLKDWLDPDNTGALIVNGRNACTPPDIAFTITPNPAIPGDAVSFDSTVSGGVPPYDYEWDVNGDDLTDYTTPDCTHTYTGYFNGNVKLTVRDSEQCEISLTHAMAVDAPGVAWDSNGIPQQVCGDMDAVIEPGEIWMVPVSLTNTGSQAATNVMGFFSLPGTPADIQLLTPVLDFGDIGMAGFSTMNLEFLVEMNFGPCGDVVPFDLDTITWTGGSGMGMTDVFTAPVGGASGTQEFFSEDFEMARAFSDWTVTTGPGPHTAGAWERATGGDQQPTGSTGYFAMSDSDAAGSGSQTSTILTSPVIDCSSVNYGPVTLEADVYFNYFSYGGSEVGSIEVFDGSAWQTLVSYTTDDFDGHFNDDVSAYAVQNANFQVRFSYQNASYDWWFSVDNIVVNAPVDPVCDNTDDCGSSGTPTPSNCLNHGDVTLDGEITAGDAQLAFTVALGGYTPTFEEECAADCNGDGEVTAGDAQGVFATALGSGSCMDPL